MRLLNLLISFLFIFFSNRSYSLVFSGGGGFGQTTMSNEISESEGPMIQTWTVERLQHSYLAIGVEHLRSFSMALNSSAACTGLLARYYFNAAPTYRFKAEEVSSEIVMSRDIAFFVGLGGGFAQSSRLPAANGLSSNAAGIYISPRGGFDYQLGQNLGIRAEGIFSMTLFGKGSLMMMSLGGSFYWIF